MARVRAYSKTDTRHYDKRRRDVGGNAMIGLGAGFLVAYLSSEAALASQNHLWHWLGAGVGALVGYFVAYGWLLRRLDVQQPAAKKVRR
ncbi:MAG: hypothetical protein M3176_08495 [Chloroflexota bacterium]|nr:hypothetical protein [Chloroflexota bacterium]